MHRGKRKLIVLFGGFMDAYTLGDFIAARETVKALRDVVPEARIVLFSDFINSEPPKSPMCRERIEGVEVVSSSWRDLPKRLRLAKGCDLLIGAGVYSPFGHIFSRGIFTALASKTMYWQVSAISDKLRASRNARNVISQTVNPVLLKRAVAVTVREASSMATFNSMGVDVWLSGDVSINAPSASRERVGELLDKLGVGKGEEFVAVCPRHYEHKLWGELSLSEIWRYRVELYRILSFVSKEIGKAVLVPFCIAPENDLALCEWLSRKRVAILDTRNCSANEVVGVLRASSLLVSVRYHPLVVASAGHVPLVALAFDHKLEGFMRMVGQGNSVCDMRVSGYEDCVAGIARTWRDRDSIRRETAKAVAGVNFRANLDALIAADLAEGMRCI